MLNDSVVVSGLGPVSSIGIGRDAFRRGIEEGRVGTGPIRSFDTTGFPYVDAGEVVDFDPCAILTALDESEWGRSSLLAASVETRLRGRRRSGGARSGALLQRHRNDQRRVSGDRGARGRVGR